MRRWLLGTLLTCAVGACGISDKLLDGSLGDFYDLGCQSVRARLYDSELSIEYVKETGEVPVRVTVRRAEHDPTGSGTVDLGMFGDVTGVSEGADIPAFSRGELELESYRPEDGRKISGLFDAVFTSGDTEVSLHGEFSTRLTVVN